MTITIRAELRVGSEQRDDFVKVAAALAEATTEEPGTLRYDWYSSADPTLLVVIEEYTDPDAAMAHNQHCEDLLVRMGALSEMTSVHLHGALGPVLDEWVADRPFAHAHPPLT